GAWRCQASTASTANSGSVCSHARMASANPCPMKNCADSAAQAMSSAATRIAGAAQRTVAGLVARSDSPAARRNIPPQQRPRIMLLEPNSAALRNYGMLLKDRPLLRKIEAIVGAAALFASQSTSRDQPGHAVYVANFELRHRGARDGSPLDGKAVQCLPQT